ncbi:calcium-activated potassium channel subunit beta-3 [Trachinotus anak]|uniref:calcium-activated potassium channel subunit beta-3 n=1 Tax=Trachinotus anak TaxID=443729 RepID=UPI0039F1B366
MFLNTASPRRSFSIPININLQGARRRQTRDRFHTATQEQEWCRGVDGRGGQRARSQMPVSSVGEDRAILLGFTMMAFSVLMFFVVGITIVKPFVNSNWVEEVSCVLVQADILKDWVDCRGVSTVPCLSVMVNLTGSNQSAFLHFDEESVLLAPECFYIPKCQMDRADLQAEVQRVKRSLDAQLGSTFPCFTDHTRHPRDVILSRKYTLKKVLFALLWPCLMLCGGALLVGLVKLTQCLAHLSSEMCSETAGNRLEYRTTQGTLYRLLRRSSVQSPS